MTTGNPGDVPRISPDYDKSSLVFDTVSRRTLEGVEVKESTYSYIALGHIEINCALS